jgi:molecular chaperone DnaK
VPVKKSETFTTAADMQTAVTVHVFQGERPMARDNTSLGEFNLEGLAPAPRGVPKIEVSFDIDASGILNVTASDTATGRSQSIRISGSTRLPEADKARMVKEAETYAAEDKRRREEADALNNADAICYQGERFLADFGEKLTTAQRTPVEQHLKDIKTAIAAKKAAECTRLADALKKQLQEAGAALYAQARPTAAPQSAATEPADREPVGQGAHGRVVDAEYREKP